MPHNTDSANKVLILDNGGYSQKIGYSFDAEPRIIPNCITKAKSERRRQFIGDQIDECKDFSGLFYIYPFQKGYVVNWDVMKQIWDYSFGHDVCNTNVKETCIIVTEPYFNFSSIKETMTEIFFEDYKFHSLLRVNAGTLSAHKYHKAVPSEQCCVIIDSGFSFTHIIPYVKGKKVKNAIRRINVGGKILTNHLKDIISYRQLNVMDETYVMNQVKEDVCYVSTDFWNDIKIAQKKANNTVVRDYVLPDYTVIKRGYVRPLEETTGRSKDNEQILRMNNDRFQVPEILFHPSDIGIREMGIAEAVVHSVSATPEEIQPHLYKNIVLTGGNVCFPGFKERLYNDVRALIPDLFDLSITLPQNPITQAWQGGCALSQDLEFSKLIVTRKQYEEHGMGFCSDKFDV